ncbi:MAG: hypothetical protein ACYTG5_02585 [Planctomycetota bacterium]|jgi:hypothetical protein
MIIAATILAASLFQDPAQSAPWAMEAAVTAPGSMVVSGLPELTPAEADDSALEQANEEMRRHLAEKGAEVISRATPIWLPEFVERKVLTRWLNRQRISKTFEVLDDDRIPRDHGHSMSYQTHLVIRRDADRLERSYDRLRRDTANQGESFLVKCGGTVILWAVLALLCGWMDRLTRGYMTTRLRLLFSGLGFSLPALAFTLV